MVVSGCCWLLLAAFVLAPGVACPAADCFWLSLVVVAGGSLLVPVVSCYFWLFSGVMAPFAGKMVAGWSGTTLARRRVPDYFWL